MIIEKVKIKNIRKTPKTLQVFFKINCFGLKYVETQK